LKPAARHSENVIVKQTTAHLRAVTVSMWQRCWDGAAP